MTRSATILRLLGATALGLWLGLSADPAEGESASILVTADIVYPLGIATVDLVEQEPSLLTSGVKTSPSARHLELLLYPGGVTESQIQLGRPDRSSTVFLHSNAATVEVVVNTITVAGDSLVVVTIIPISQ